MVTLDYATPSPREWPTIGDIYLWLAGLLPTLLLFLAVYDNEVSGDPVASLGHFKAYHYVSLGVAIFLTVWLCVVVLRCPKRYRILTATLALQPPLLLGVFIPR